jgi:hypothetical protein
MAPARAVADPMIGRRGDRMTFGAQGPEEGRKMTNDNTTITTNLFSFATAAAVREELETLGVEGPAADLIIKAGAPARHEARVKATIAAAYAATTTQVGKDGEFGRACHAASAAATILADMIGIGGELGLTGAATSRLPAFSGLGTGRKQAGDGAAYMAAASAALDRVLFEVGANDVIVGLDFETDEPYVGLCNTTYGPEDAGSHLGWVYLSEAGVLPEWVRAIAGNIVLALSKGETALRVGNRLVSIEADLARWAKVFNGVADAR